MGGLGVGGSLDQLKSLQARAHIAHKGMFRGEFSVVNGVFHVLSCLLDLRVSYSYGEVSLTTLQPLSTLTIPDPLELCPVPPSPTSASLR